MRNLKLARLLKGFSQWEISVRSGVCQSKISLVERGFSSLNPDEVRKVADVLGVEISELFEPDQPRKPAAGAGL